MKAAIVPSVNSRWEIQEVPTPEPGPGQSSMIHSKSDADWVVVWFSYESASGGVLYDSDYGVNYRFGFPCREIDGIEAVLTARPDATGFEVVVRTAPEVEGVKLQYSLVADPASRVHRARPSVAAGRPAGMPRNRRRCAGPLMRRVRDSHKSTAAQ